MREIAVPVSLLLEGSAYLGFGLEKADIAHCAADRPFDGHVFFKAADQGEFDLPVVRLKYLGGHHLGIVLRNFHRPFLNLSAKLPDIGPCHATRDSVVTQSQSSG